MPEDRLLLSNVHGTFGAGVTAGTYLLTPGSDSVVASGSAGHPRGLVIAEHRLRKSNLIVPKLRIQAAVITNATAPLSTFTFGLYPITLSGGAAANIYTVGTVVPGSNGAVVVAPALNTASEAVSAEFDVPADGLYAIGVVISVATTAASSQTQVEGRLLARYPD